jgi:hypothetical protein
MESNSRDCCLVLAWIVAALCLALAISAVAAFAHDDGRFADSPHKAWFDQLASGKGLCCSFADGVSVQDVDWTNTNPDKCTIPSAAAASGEPMSNYCVRLDKQWLRVPQSALILKPNEYGPAVVWPIIIGGEVINIRCFIPGAGT